MDAENTVIFTPEQCIDMHRKNCGMEAGSDRAGSVHRSKERQRGFNQAAYLAEKLGHYTGISTDVNIVQKVLKTKSQKN